MTLCFPNSALKWYNLCLKTENGFEFIEGRIWESEKEAHRVPNFWEVVFCFQAEILATSLKTRYLRILELEVGLSSLHLKQLKPNRVIWLKSHSLLVCRVTRSRAMGHILCYLLTPSECLRRKVAGSWPALKLSEARRVPGAHWWFFLMSLLHPEGFRNNNFQPNTLLIKQSQSSWWSEGVNDHSQYLSL